MTTANQTPNNNRKILILLAQYKFLSSKQIWDLTGAAFEGKPYNQTQTRLSKLKNAGLVRLEVIKNAKGNIGPHQWVLTRAGAKLINFDDYGKHFERPISRYQAELHKLEIDLGEQIGLTPGGWRLVKSFKSSSTHPLPESTEQYEWLCQVLTWQEYQRTGRLPPKDGPHTLMVPPQANHHLAYLPNCHAAVIFILPHPRATDKFWQEREKEYGRLVEKIPVYGVFPNRNRLQGSQRVLGKYNFNGVSIGQVSGLLTRILN